MEEPAGFAAIRFGSAIGFVLAVEAAEDVVLGGPFDVIADEEVEQAVAIVIEPERGGAEGLTAGEAAAFVTSTNEPFPLFRNRRL